MKFLPGGRLPADEPLMDEPEVFFPLRLSPDAARELAADLLQRAEHVDPRTPERVAAYHQQVGRADGTWGCRCGWKQDKPHREHVADMVAAATTTPETGA